eukprot:4379842-Amphidinium_carterae.1
MNAKSDELRSFLSTSMRMVMAIGVAMRPAPCKWPPKAQRCRRSGQAHSSEPDSEAWKPVACVPRTKRHPLGRYFVATCG